MSSEIIEMSESAFEKSTELFKYIQTLESDKTTIAEWYQTALNQNIALRNTIQELETKVVELQEKAWKYDSLSK